MTQAPSIPEQVRALLSEEPSNREAARELLFSSVAMIPPGKHEVEVAEFLFQDVFFLDMLDQLVFVLDTGGRVIVLSEPQIDGSRYNIRVGDRFFLEVTGTESVQSHLAVFTRITPERFTV